MNCPNCGAENEAGARFCVECGAPLESPVDLPPAPPEFDEGDTDRTILSSASRIAEEAKTVAVTQDQLAAAEATFSNSASSFNSTPSSAGGAGGFSSSGGGGFWTQRNIIIIAVVAGVLLLLCCCCSVLIGVISADPEILDNLGLRLLPAYLPYI